MDHSAAVDMLLSCGVVECESSNRYPSINERDAHAVLVATPDPRYFVHKPTGFVVLRGVVGMGATAHTHTDSYPYEVIKVVSDTCLQVREMLAIPTGKFVPSFNREQSWKLTRNPMGTMYRIRLNKRGSWQLTARTHFTVGVARRFYDYSL